MTNFFDDATSQILGWRVHFLSFCIFIVGRKFQSWSCEPLLDRPPLVVLVALGESSVRKIQLRFGTRWESLPWNNLHVSHQELASAQKSSQNTLAR